MIPLRDARATDCDQTDFALVTGSETRLARKWTYPRRSVRPPIDDGLAALIERMASGNMVGGYQTIQGGLRKHVIHPVSRLWRLHTSFGSRLQLLFWVEFYVDSGPRS